MAKILFIDSNDKVVGMLKYSLLKRGSDNLEIDLTCSLDEGIQKSNEKDYQLIVVDVYALSGAECLSYQQIPERIRHGRKLRILIYSSLREAWGTELCGVRGNHFLQKQKTAQLEILEQTILKILLTSY